MTGELEPAFRRIRAEHHVLRALLTAVGGHATRAGRRRVARHLAFIENHVDYEDDAFSPFVAAQVPSVARAMAHAEDERRWIAAELPDLLHTLRAGRRCRGPLIEGLRHHFAEDEAYIGEPELAAGLTATPLGEVGTCSRCTMGSPGPSGRARLGEGAASGPLRLSKIVFACRGGHQTRQD